jgi:hypothetical protein
MKPICLFLFRGDAAPQREAAVGVTDRAAKRGIAAYAVMHVVAAFYRQRNVITERPKDIVGPRPECHHRFASRN